MFENISENIHDTSAIESAVEAEEVDHDRKISTDMRDSTTSLDREVEQTGNGLILWLLIGALLFLLCLLAYNLWLGSRQTYTRYIDPNYHLQY